MKKIILSLSIVVCIIFIVLISIVFIVRRTTPETSQPTFIPTQEENQEKTKTLVWLRQTSLDKLALIVDSAGESYDTFQLAFKADQELIQEFIPSFSPDFTLRVKKIEKGEIILLFSTNGEQKALNPIQSLGEFLVIPEADLADLIFDQNQTKIIKQGQEFSINFLGIKNE